LAKTEAEALAEWCKFWSGIKTPEYRAAFLIRFDVRLLPALLDKLNLHTALELVASLKAGAGE